MAASGALSVHLEASMAASAAAAEGGAAGWAVVAGWGAAWMVVETREVGSAVDARAVARVVACAVVGMAQGARARLRVA